MMSILCVKQIQSNYSYPIWKYAQNITIINKIYTKTIVNNNLIVVICQSDRIFQVYDAKTTLLIKNLDYRSLCSNSSITDVDIIDNKYFYLLSSSNKQIYVYDILTGNEYNKTIATNVSYSIIKLTQNQIVLYQDLRKEIKRVSKSGNVVQTRKLSNTNNPLQIKVCEVIGSHYFIGFWHADCYYYILFCQNSINCTQYNSSNNCSITSDIIQKRQSDFSFDCKYFIQIWTNQIPQVVNLLTKQIISYPNHKTINISQKIYFLDKSNLNYGQIALSMLTQSRIENISSINNQDNLNISLPDSMFTYNKFNRLAVYQSSNYQYVGFAVLSCQGLYIFNEKLGVCQTCPQYFVCNTCDQGYVYDGSYGCKLFVPGQDEQIYQQRIRVIIQRFIDSVFQYTEVTPISSAILIFQILPVSFLFMKFINFWTICSFYLFVPFDLPESLEFVLFSINQIISTSIFNFFNIHLNIQMDLQQKFPKQLNQKFGLTSDFLNSNLQNFLILLFSYFILLIIYLINKILSQDNFLRLKLSSVKYSSIMLIQYASIMSSFYFVLITIKNYGYQLDTMQKVNQILYLSFFIFSTLTPFFVIILIQKKTKKITKKDILQKLQIFYECACNSFIPLVSLLDNLPLFLIFNLFFFIFSTYLAFHAESFKINRIIISTYFILFHIGFILVTILNRQIYSQIYDIIIFSMKIILFLGALHEGLTLIFGLFYDIFILVKNYLFPKQNKLQKDESNNRQKNNLKKQKNINIIGKTSGELQKVTPIIQNDQNIKKKQKFTKSFYILKGKDFNKTYASFKKIQSEKSEKFIQFKNNKINKFNTIKKTMQDKSNKQHINFTFVYKNGSLRRLQ